MNNKNSNLHNESAHSKVTMQSMQIQLNVKLLPPRLQEVLVNLFAGTIVLHHGIG